MAQSPIPAQPYYPQIDKSVDPNVTVHLQRVYPALNQHDKAIVNLKSQLDSLASAQGYKVSGSSVSKTSSTSSSTSSSSVTATQAQQIAAAQVAVNFPTQLQLNLGNVNNQTGTSYTVQQSDYGGIITLDNAAPVAVTLNNGMSSSVNRGWFASIENLGAGTATLTPISGTVNLGASITLVTNQGALVFYDGKNWWALTSLPLTAGGVTSLNALSGALSLTSTGSTVTITPSGSTIDLEVAGGTGLPVNNPTFTGTITGPHYDGNGSSPAIVPDAGLGTGGTATLSATSKDSRGTMTLTVGTPSGSGNFADVTFATAYAATPVVVFSAANVQAAFNSFYISAVSASGFTIAFSGSASTASVFVLNYIVMG